MPSSSKAQRNFMAAVAHSPAFAKKVGVSQAVGKDFNKADKGRKFKEGGDTMATKKPMPKGLFGGKESMKEELKEAKAIKSGKITPMQYAKGEKSEGVHKMAKGGMTALAKHAAKPADKAHAGLTAKKMAAGGSTTMKKQAGAGRGFVNPQRLDESDEDYVTPKQRMAMETQTRESKDTEAATKGYNKASAFARGGGIESRGKTKGAMVSMQKFAGGGFVKSADGIATKGKTKATQVAMKKGGMC